MMELKYYKLRSKLDEDISSSAVVDDDLVFVEDTKEIYTHSTFFGQSDYCILNYDNIKSSTGDPFVGNINSTTNIYIQVGVFVTPATKYISGRSTNYIGNIIQSADGTLNIHYVNITWSAPPNRTFSANDASFETSAVTSDEKTMLANLLGKTYIAGDELVDHDVDCVTLSAYDFATGSVSSGSEITIDQASQTAAGMMSAADKKALDDVVDKLSTYDVIKTKALFGDKFVVRVDGILNYNDIRSQVLSEKAPSDHVTVNGLYIVNNYISGNRPTLMLKVNDNYYTSWDATTFNSIPIAASSVKVNNNYVVIDESGNASYNTLYVQRHYASQDITAMYHLNSTGVMVSASEALNDYVYENALLN